MALNLIQLVEHGRAELAIAIDMCDRHQPSVYGLCTCNRTWPCSIAESWAVYARYWRARLAVSEPQLAALTGPTLILETIR